MTKLCMKQCVGLPVCGQTGRPTPTVIIFYIRLPFVQCSTKHMHSTIVSLHGFPHGFMFFVLPFVAARSA